MHVLPLLAPHGLDRPKDIEPKRRDLTPVRGHRAGPGTAPLANCWRLFKQDSGY